jgi:hypothetical protein
MCRRSDTAQALYRKAKGGRRLSVKEVKLIDYYAKRMVETVGLDPLELDINPDRLDNVSIDLQPETILQGDRARIVKRGKWLTDEVTDCVVGRCEQTVTLYPNSVVLVNDLVRALYSVVDPLR